MRKRGGYPIIVEIRCGADNGACGFRVLDTGVVLAPDGPRVFEQQIAPMRTPGPNMVKRLRAPGKSPRIPRRMTPEGRTGDLLSHLSNPFVTCPREGHGRGIVTAQALLDGVEEFRSTGTPATVVFIPSERVGWVKVAGKVIELDVDWWAQQDIASRERWWQRHGGAVPPR